jgi:predicted RNA binding protein YcfA (HicA-like mRNA interferase family)
MSEKLPRVTADKVIRVLERARFSMVRQSGSHKIYKNKDGKDNHPLSFRKNFASQNNKKYP